MKNKFYTILTVALSISLILTACEEPIGNQGPQGPQGPQGLEGPKGPVGPAGEDGSQIYAGYGPPSIDIGSPGDYYLNGTTGELYGPKSANGWGGPIIVLKGEDGEDGQDGRDGQDGADGQDGTDGQDGQDGTDGEDGSQIYAGSGAPNAAVGVPGDYYLDRVSYELFGPKTSSGWGAPLNLRGPRGPAGPAGEDGSVIHAGTGAPADNVGKNGDFYLNKNTGELYGPKNDDGWGTPISLQGPSGEDGQDGADGQDGSQIYAGSGAPEASLGVEGDYYLDKASYELYGPKNGNDWGPPLNLRGPVGPAGEDGSIMYAGEGAPGDDIGGNGDYYLNQNTGELYGPKDADGWGNPIIVLKGEDGQDGADGQDGQDGQDGEDGSQIHSGPGVPEDDLGKEGDFYLDKDSYELYGPKTSDGWGAPLNLKGADGNANVTRYIFPGHDFSSTANTLLTFSEVDSTAMRQSSWNTYLVNQIPSVGVIYDHVPGITDWGDTYSIFHRWLNFVMQIEIELKDGEGIIYEQIEVVRVQANNTEDHTKIADGTIIPDHLDLSNYEEVAEYYGFYQ